MLQTSVRVKNNNIKFYQLKLKAGVVEAARETARELESIAKGKVPVDTGALRNSIGAYVEGFFNPVIHFSATKRYAMYVEKGTRSHRAQPYFYPAIDIAVENYQQRIKRLFN